MAGLLDELTKYKFNPNATSMGLLQAGAQMLANSGPSYQPQGGFGSALGQGLGGFTQGYMGFNQNQQEQEMLRQRMELERKKLAQEQFRLDNPQHSVDPYTSIERGPNGELYLANHRETDPTKVLQKVLVDGQSVRAGSLDPITQGAIQNSKSGNTFSKQTMGDGSEKTMLNYTASRLGGIDQATGMSVQSSGGSTGVFKNPAAELQKVGIQSTGDSLLDSQKLIDYYNSNPNAAIPINRSGSPVAIGQSTADKAAIETQAAIDKAAGVERAKNLVAAQESLPQAMHEAQYTEKLIDELMTHPGMSGVIGVPNGKELFPGTKESSFNVRRSQLDGRAFLQAFQSLKGGGQITEVEGAKATAAIARLGRTQSEEEYKSALMELKQMLNDAREIAKVKAGGTQQGAPLDDKRARLEALRTKHLRLQQ
jgi:hypothetical protein